MKSALGAMDDVVWTGPFQIRVLLERCLDPDQAWPPAETGVYLVSREPWTGQPSAQCRPLYFGGNTGRPGRFCTRVGDLVADLFGFYDGHTGHHSGGQSLYRWCSTNHVHPADLYLGWATWASSSNACARCLEYNTGMWLTGGYEHMETSALLNKKVPPVCTLHCDTART